jgi:hypothetical protein
VTGIAASDKAAHLKPREKGMRPRHETLDDPGDCIAGRKRDSGGRIAPKDGLCIHLLVTWNRSIRQQTFPEHAPAGENKAAPVLAARINKVDRYRGTRIDHA